MSSLSTSVMLAPAPIGDPITAWDVDGNGRFVVGYASGRVLVLSSPGQAASGRSVTIDASGRRWSAQIMQERSEELVRAVVALDDTIQACIGDQGVWEFTDHHSSAFFAFQVAHDPMACLRSHVLQHDTSILLLKAGEYGAVLFDLLTTRQQTVMVGFPTKAIPVAFDSRRIIWVDEAIASAPKLVICEYANDPDSLEKVPLHGWRPRSAISVTGWHSVHTIGKTRESIAVASIRQRGWETSECWTVRAHRHTIVGLESWSHPFSKRMMVATLSESGSFKIWSSARCLAAIRLREPSFSMGYPYRIARRGGRFQITADQGLFEVMVPELPDR
ncbi:Anaphase-promoting complex subunit 4 WD40 domain-containing protein [Plasmodiophora brassicae]